MSKKVKKQQRSAVTAGAANVTPSVSTNGSRTYDREFTPDYTGVKKDLRRIAMLAGSFFVVLLTLSFFLR